MRDQAIRRRFLLLRQGLVLLTLAGVLAAYFLFDLQGFFTFEALAAESLKARGLIENEPVKLAGLFVITLALVTLFCLPAVALLQILSGFLFGPLAGTLLSVTAQTLGGVLAFQIARSTFRESVAGLVGPYLGKLQSGLKANAFSYVVALRMTPIMPYWVVNIALGLLGIGLRPFALGTLVGGVPLAFVYTTFGTGLGEVIEAGGTPGLRDLVTPRALALVALALLFALAPLLLRRWVQRRTDPVRKEPR